MKLNIYNIIYEQFTKMLFYTHFAILFNMAYCNFLLK